MTIRSETLIPWFLPDTEISVRSVMSWDPAAPFEVKIEFYDARSLVTWHIGRDLFRDAITTPCVFTGTGDVMMIVREGNLELELSSPYGYVRLEASAYRVRQFVMRTYDEVPAGQELPDLDAAIRQLLEEA